MKQILSLLLSWPLISFASENRDFGFSASCANANEVTVVSLTGDILVHDAIYRSVVAGSKDFSQIWRKSVPLWTKADFSIANLEGPAAMGIDTQGRDHGDVGFIYDKKIYSGTDMRFNFHPRILSDLAKSGIDLLTLANNHSLDRKGIGIDKTLEAAAAINLPTVGTRSSSDRGGAFYKIVQVKDLNIAVIGCTEMTNGFADSKDQVLFCYKHAKEIESTISSIRRNNYAHAIIVYPHWGQEYKNSPDNSQRTYARRFLEAGATAVVGSHPHVLQPWEKYITKDGRETLIAYSLGNFVAYQKGIERKTGVVVYIGLSQASHQKGAIVSALYSPTYRAGTEVFPVNESSDAGREAQKYFGSKNRLQQNESAHRKMCGT